MAVVDNKRIAKNTVYLYIRMLFSMAVGLYTSRTILHILGAEDYGIYNVVGGIVTMLSFINLGMVASTQRFISYELGRDNLPRLSNVFNTAIRTHVLLAVIILLIAETLGLWFVNYKLNIPADRVLAANVVYQCALTSFTLTVISVPYNACIVAHERMNMFAIVSILETVLKLVAVLIIPLFRFDKLIVYAVALVMVSVLIRIIYTWYCRKHFVECQFKAVEKDKALFNDMFSFAGWSLIGNLGFSVKDQGINALINVFFNASMNAARGIAYQVSGVIYYLVSNFQMAINPQITKSYAVGEKESMLNLVFRGSRLSFCLLMLIVIPVYIRSPYLMDLWLVDVPENTLVFLKLVLVMQLVDSMAAPFVVGIQATGDVKRFQILISIIMFANLPISYVLLKLGMPFYTVMYVAIATSLVGLFTRVLLLKGLVPFKMRRFTLEVFARNIFTCSVAFVAAVIVNKYIPDSFLGMVLFLFISVVISLITVCFVGISKDERALMINLVRKKIIKKIIRYGQY